MTELAIRTPTGALVVDSSWACVADVMRSAHYRGLTHTAVDGDLVRIDSETHQVLQVIA